VAEGLGFYPNWREIRGGHVRARRVRHELLGRDDMWDPMPASRERGEGTDSGILFSWAAGRFLAWAERLPRGLFFLFFFFSLFFSVFF
jgi:hypothetical protein